MRILAVFIFLTISRVCLSQSFETLDSLFQSNNENGNYKACLEIAEDMLVNCVSVYGIKSEECIKANRYKGLAHYVLGQIEEAGVSYKKAVEDCRKFLGEDNAEYGNCVDGLAIYYLETGEYKNAEPLFVEAIENGKKYLPVDNSEFYEKYYNLGLLYRRMGRYNDALTYLKKYQDDVVKYSGKENADYAYSLHSMAGLYWRLNQFHKAIPLSKEALKYAEIYLGEEHPNYSRFLSRLSILYYKIGSYEEALSLNLRSLKLTEETLGKEHPRYGEDLNDLSLLSSKLGDHGKAIQYGEQALQHSLEQLGEDSPQYGIGLNNMGGVCKVAGFYERALNYYSQSLAHTEKYMGKQQIRYGIILNNMGEVYNQIGRFDEALVHFEGALNHAEKYLGREHPSYSGRLNDVAIAYANMEQYDVAIPIAIESNQRSTDYMNNIFSFATEREKKKFLRSINGRFDEQYSFAWDALDKDADASQLCYNNTLLLKGILLDQSSILFENVANSADQNVKDEFDQWLSLKGDISKEIILPIKKQSGLLDSLLTAANDLEQSLVMASADFRRNKERFDLNWKDIGDGLDDNEAAIEFIEFNYLRNRKTDSVLYAAILVRSKFEKPVLIPLFEENQLNKVLASSYELPMDYIKRLYGLPEQKGSSTSGPKNLLYELTWGKMESELEGIDRIYYSSAGLLHQINLEALTTTEGEIFSDRFSTIKLGSTRQVLDKKEERSTINLAVLYGGINFQYDSSGVSIPNDEVSNSLLANRTSDSNVPLRGGVWNYLPGSKSEVVELNSILQKAEFSTIIHTGLSATEESFYSISDLSTSPRILHFATHGYFFPDPGLSKRDSSVSKLGLMSSENPMVRSGLILAGGNYAWTTGEVFKPDLEDGILTAYEISQMNLRSTELVVLSACETGLGDIEGNEGVYGLQRAFKIAGAKNLIMSLWQVPDKHTKELMIAFYSKYLNSEMSIHDAFKKAQVEMRLKYKNPYLWAGFILLE